LGLEQYSQLLVDAQADLEAVSASIRANDVRLGGLQGEIDRLHRDITALGAVNLAALEELASASERKHFLDAQTLDLTDAMNTLEDAIRKIDAETRELLGGTFKVVNEHFGRMFPELFGGGNARLVMTGDEILDAGVQVLAQPPGKKNQTIHLLSGGEKARLALSLIVWQKPNLLLLDEPSNHLDVETREALTTALAEFGGSMLLVSHDRHLLRTTVDSFWIVADGGVQEFDGDLEDYRDWLAQHQANARKQDALVREAIKPTAQGVAPSQDAQASVGDRKNQKREQAQERQRLAQRRKPIENKLKTVEKDLEATQLQVRALDERIADPDLYDDTRRQERMETLAKHGELTKRASELEERWLSLQEELEQLELSSE
jgi:chromosome segregation ATPase